MPSPGKSTVKAGRAAGPPQAIANTPDPTLAVVPEIHIGSCAQCSKPVTRESFFVTTWPQQPERAFHLSCAPRTLSLNCSAKANCMRCGQALGGDAVAITVMARSCRVHVRCRDAFALVPAVAVAIEE